MQTNKEKAIEEVVRRLIDEVDKEFANGNNPYSFEDRVVRVSK